MSAGNKLTRHISPISSNHHHVSFIFLFFYICFKFMADKGSKRISGKPSSRADTQLKSKKDEKRLFFLCRGTERKAKTGRHRKSKVRDRLRKKKKKTEGKVDDETERLGLFAH